MGKTEQTVGDLLSQWKGGDLVARDRLFEFLYTDLKNISAALLRHEGAVSLSPGDLVNECVIKLLKLDRINWQDKTHFLALSARMMRQLLIDHARQKQSNKRQHKKVTLMTHLAGDSSESVDLLDLEEALCKLNGVNEDHAQIVEMRYFGGLTLDETAEVLGSSRATVQRRWRAARAWLAVALKAA